MRTNDYERNDEGSTADILSKSSQNGSRPRVLSDLQLSDWRGDITTLNGFTGTRPAGEFLSLTWGEVVNIVCPATPAIVCEKRDGLYFLPCQLCEAPLVGNTLDAAIRSGRPTVGKMRSKQHVTQASMLVLDVDGLSEADFDAALKKVRDDGITFLAFTTHSHGSAEKPGVRARIVIPLDRSVTVVEYSSAWYGFDAYYVGGAK